MYFVSTLPCEIYIFILKTAIATVFKEKVQSARSQRGDMIKVWWLMLNYILSK